MRLRTLLTLTEYLLFVTVLSMLIVFAAGAETRIVVNKKNSVTAITKADLKHIFLGEKRFWSGNKVVSPVIQTGAAKEAFYDIMGLSETAFKKAWIKTSLSGRCDPPVSVKSDQQVIAFIKGNEGSVGFVSAKMDTSDVKTLTIK